jgi:hypothetical protein
MNQRLIDADDLKSVLKKVGINGEESSQCMGWNSPKIEQPLTPEDKVLVELSREEQGFLRCMGYAYEEKVVDFLRLAALHETFWNTVRSLHNLPMNNLTVKGGKYVVAL